MSSESPISAPLTLFLFDGYDVARNVRVRGSWWAHSREQAHFWLTSQGYCNIALTPSAKSIVDMRVSDLSLALFYRQLAVMFRAGIPLTDSLRLASYSEDRHLSGICLMMADEINNGHSLSGSMKPFPGVFDNVVVGLMGAAESSGRLHHVLGRMADAKERQYRLRKSIVSAMTYPAILFLATTALAILFVIYIFPINRELLSSANMEMPAFNRALGWVVDVVSSPVFPVLLLGLGGWIWFLFRSRAFRIRLRERWLALLLFIPPIRNVMAKARSLLMLEILGLLLGGGGTIDQALRLMIRACPDEKGRRDFQKIRTSVIEGADFSHALQESGYFPPMISSLLQVGYETGRVDEMAIKGVEICEEDVRVALDTATALLEPLMLAFAGLLAGVAIISSALPMLSLLRGL